MENASKALIMAGTVIIGVMIIGIMVYLFRVGATVGENYEVKKTTEQIDAFNAKFEVYQRDNNTISDVVSAANLAYSINIKNEYDNINKVDMEVKIGSKTLCIASSKDLKKNNFFVAKLTDSITSSTKMISFYKLMDTNLSDIEELFLDDYSYPGKLTDVNEVDSSTERIYRYYFEMDEINYNSITGLIDKISFIMSNPKF